MFAEAEVANRTVDAVPIDPNARVRRPVEPAAAAAGQPAAMEANTDGQRDVRGNTTDGQTSTRKLVWNAVVVRAGGAAPQPDVSQARPMDVSLGQKAITDTKERADSMLPIEAMKYSANADVGYQYEHYIGELWDQDKCVAKHFSVIRRGKKSEVIGGIHVRVAAIPSENGDFVRWSFRQSIRKVRWFRRYASIESISNVDGKSCKSTSHSARSSQDYCNLGLPQRDGSVDS